MIGLVLAGGGGKGFYQIGVYKAFEELGITEQIQAISGTSAGAMNAVMFAQGGHELAYKFWKALVPENAVDDEVEEVVSSAKLLPSYLALTVDETKEYLDGLGDEVWDLMTKTYKVFKREHVADIVRDMVPACYNPDKSVIVTCGDVSNFKAEFRAPLAIWDYFRGNSKEHVAYLSMNGADHDHLSKALLATSALPLLFSEVEIDGKYYMDGGIYDNVPIKPIYEAGFRKLIVIRLNRTVDLDYSNYPDCKIVDILPVESPGNFITGTLDLTDEAIDERIEKGYKDAMTLMHRVVTLNNKTMTLHEALVDEGDGLLNYDNGQVISLTAMEKVTSTLREIVKG